MGQSKKVDKIPYYLRRKDKNLIFLAGLYATVEFQDTSETLSTFTIITGPAPNQTKWLHERMPIVLTPGTKKWDLWLDNEKEWDESLADSLTEYDKEDLEWYEVTKDVGKVTNEGVYLTKPLKRGGIGDFFGKNKKEQIKGEAQSFKKEEELKEETDVKPDITDLLKTEGGSKENGKEPTVKEESVEQDYAKVDEKEQEQNGSKRPAEDSTISERLQSEQKKPKKLE